MWGGVNSLDVAKEGVSRINTMSHKGEEAKNCELFRYH